MLDNVGENVKHVGDNVKHVGDNVKHVGEHVGDNVKHVGDNVKQVGEHVGDNVMRQCKQMTTVITPQDKKKKAPVKTRRQRSTNTVDETREEHSRGVPRPKREEKGLPRITEKIIETFTDNAVSVGLEGYKKLYKDLSSYMTENYRYTAFEANADKNRYADVICLDDSRVKLTLEVPPSSEYIHASWVKFEKHDRDYIAAQGPMPTTVGDFWRMVYQEQCCAIVNLTKTVEEGKIKCAQYWPLEAQQYENHGKMFVQTKKVESEERFIVYTIEVLPEGCSNSLVVKLIHMISWPDRGVPMSAKSVLRLLRLISTTDKQVLKGPVLVHCSAGIGRTGSIIMIDVLIRQIFMQNKLPDIVDIFKQLRNQRASAIQQEGQFIFVMTTVLEYIKLKMEAADRNKYKERCDKVQGFVNEVQKDTKLITG